MNEDSGMTIVEFLEARIAEDEAQASKHLPALRSHGLGDYGFRVLAECTAKRVILSGYDDALDTYAGSRVMDHVLEALAAVYKDHPDYDPTWSSAGVGE